MICAIAIDAAWDCAIDDGDCISRLHQALEETEAVLWADSEAEARQRRYEQAQNDMMELYS